ncbi:MAG TPA: phosphatase PAP2 family protein [Bacteroidia bacterium]|nr:phosphatase PAP2 family protein [Bacteroidia bacterium]
MKSIIKKNTFFLLPYLLFLIIGGFFLTHFSKSTIHLYINQFHCSVGDQVAPFITNFGSYFAFLILISLLFYNYRFSIIVIGAFLISSIFTQTLKHTIFNNVLRPAAYFKDIHSLYLVPGVKMNFYHSFPSGHATTAFAVYFSLALLSEKKLFKFLFFILALSVDYSRVYLSQHFLIDVYFGSIVGTLSAFLSYYIVENTQLLKNKTWINHSLIRKN